MFLRSQVQSKIFPGLVAALVLTTFACHAITFTNNASITSSDTNYDGQPIIVDNCQLTVDGAHAFTSLWLTNGAVLTHTPAANGETNNQINLTIAGDGVVAADSIINANYRGYARATGPGAGATGYGSEGGGGGHGGYGGISEYGAAGGPSYDSIVLPDRPGSGGGGDGSYGSYGGNGGGVIILNVGGTLQLDGSITAHGQNLSGFVLAGGGAGGAIRLTSSNLSGGGYIGADGGAGAYGGGGGGGRIAIYFATNNFSGSISAVGGDGSRGQKGGAGTICRRSTSTMALSVFLDNAGRLNGYTQLDAADTNIDGAQLTVSGATLTLNGAHHLASLLLTNAAVLTHTPAYYGEPTNQINLAITGDCVISSNSMINVDGCGFISAHGPGAGSSSNGNAGGGAHGGNGGSSRDGYPGGAGYESVDTPSLPGSGGGNGSLTFSGTGGPGGGVVRLNVGGVLQLDGRITARGTQAYGAYAHGGGAGGSIWLTAGQFSGGGALDAAGGAARPDGGPGGGGRIAIAARTDTFTGDLSAFGSGRGYYASSPSGAGTIWRENLASHFVSLTVDDAGYPGYTPLTNSSAFAGRVVDLRVYNYATVGLQSPLQLTGLVMMNHARLIPDQLLQPIELNLTGNAQVDTNSAIDASGYGWPNHSGPGAGGSAYGGGGGHGGAGGAGYNGASAGGGTNGSALDAGSGGGDSTFGGYGGYGGGSMQLQIAGNFNLEGALNANGVSGYQFGGGGAGGGIYLRAGSLLGQGVVSANGGNGGGYAGGGGGGWMDISSSDANSFQGSFGASGGIKGHYTAGDGENGQVAFVSTGVLTNYFLGNFPSGAQTHSVSSTTFLLAGGPRYPVAADFALVTPRGVLPGNQLTLTSEGNFLTLSFPPQTTAGKYAVHLLSPAGAPGTNNDGNAGFEIVWPTISGRVTFTNGWPLAGIQVGKGVTDRNGFYSFAVLPGANGSFAPINTFNRAIPAERGYSDLIGDLIGQDFKVAGNLNPELAAQTVTGKLQLAWDTVAGLRYQAQRSADLVNWLDYGTTIDATTNSLAIDFDPTNTPQKFFRVRVFSY